jgi:3-dehydroquinate synthase
MPIFAPVAEALRNFFLSYFYTSVAVLLDENTRKHCYPLVKAVLPKKHQLIEVKSGEASKNLDTCAQIWKALTELEADRNALLVNLGGGVIGDMGGFCAATYKRGIDFIQVPTTLLAQVDAAVGGKLGVDFMGYKNHIGVFNNPVEVFIDTVFLKTLPQAHIRSGFAEIIKHCLIADPVMWKKISRMDTQDHKWQELVMHSVHIKDDITSKDPHEKGLRKVLNFGHTIGHAIESFCLSKPRRQVLHGEAVAAGMLCETYLSVEKAQLAGKNLDTLEEFIFSTFGKIPFKADEIEAIASFALQDKKNKAGKIQCVLLENIGRPVLDQQISLKEIWEALAFYIG